MRFVLDNHFFQHLVGLVIGCSFATSMDVPCGVGEMSLDSRDFCTQNLTDCGMAGDLNIPFYMQCFRGRMHDEYFKVPMVVLVHVGIEMQWDV